MRRALVVAGASTGVVVVALAAAFVVFVWALDDLDETRAEMHEDEDASYLGGTSFYRPVSRPRSTTF